MKVRCLDVFRERRCSLLFGHDGLHRNGDHTWGFRDERTEPEWVRRARSRLLPVKDWAR
jgi:hypothetical protein